MFTVISLGPDVIPGATFAGSRRLIELQHHLSFSPPCLVTAPLFSAQEKSAHAHSFTSLHVQESALFLKVRPTSIHCNSVSPLYTLRSVLGPSQSNKATTGSGLVQANINNPPHSSEGRVKRGLRNGLLGY